MSSKSAQVIMAIEEDIRVRGLRPGEPYQSAREVAQMLDVSPMTADRAMRQLASNGVLDRRHGSGTFVGAAAGDMAVPALRFIQIIISATFYHVYRVIMENIVATVHRCFPADRIEQVFVPDSDQSAFCAKIVKRWEGGNQPRSVVLVGCSQQLVRFFGDTSVPVVATGGVSKAQCTVPWIDMDHREAGRLLAGYAGGFGHRHFLVLMNHLWGCGDNEFLDGIEEGLKAAGNGLDARVRSVELDARAIETVLRQALRSGNPPGGVFCTTRLTAEVAVKVAEEMNLRIPEDFVVGTVLIRNPGGRVPRYAYTRWATTRESNDALYWMVHQLNLGCRPDPDQFLIPVELVLPDEVACWT